MQWELYENLAGSFKVVQKSFIHNSFTRSVARDERDNTMVVNVTSEPESSECAIHLLIDEKKKRRIENFNQLEYL